MTRSSPTPKATDGGRSPTSVLEDEALDEVLVESFPASDPPSSWAGPDHAVPSGPSSH